MSKFPEKREVADSGREAAICIAKEFILKTLRPSDLDKAEVWARALDKFSDGPLTLGISTSWKDFYFSIWVGKDKPLNFRLSNDSIEFFGNINVHLRKESRLLSISYSEYKEEGAVDMTRILDFFFYRDEADSFENMQVIRVGNRTSVNVNQWITS